MGEPTEREWLEGLRYEDKFPECLCGAEGPDEFGNYDQLEHPECPIHGTDQPQPEAA